VLLDVVLGHGSHADPAGELRRPLAELARPPGDRARVRHPRRPAGRAAQEATLREAGVIVAPTNAAARAAGGRGRSAARMRIAMLTYSVKPRGGVVHALEVSEALARRGHRSS
jgi:hypothetical protein